MAITIALAGNPNCGKTTMFNALTGANQYVGNWPGVTVERKEGRLKKNKDVVIMTENDLENSVNKVISSINLNEEEKNRLNKIDWKNDELNKFKEVKNADKDGKELLIFVKGRENYINNMNKNIENWTNLKNVEIVDCYDINEVQNNAGEIAKQYDNVLFSSGVEKMI